MLLDETIRCLTASGWQPQREFDCSAYEKTLLREGYPIHEAAIAILRSFGGLTIQIPAYRVPNKHDTVHFDAIKANAGICIERIQEDYELRVHEKLTVVGEVYSDHMVLMASETGKIYGAYDSHLTLWGETCHDALNNFVVYREGITIT